jgi:hypothetical protein
MAAAPVQAPAPAPTDARRRRRRPHAEGTRIVDQQHENRCGKHVINNLFQRCCVVYDWDRRDEAEVTYVNMAAVTQRQNDQIRALDATLVQEAGDAQGNMNADVVLNTLDALGKRTETIDRAQLSLRLPELDADPALVGYIVPHTTTGIEHYMSFRRLGSDRYVFLESLQHRSNLIVWSLDDIVQYMKSKCYVKRGRKQQDGFTIAVFQRAAAPAPAHAPALAPAQSKAKAKAQPKAKARKRRCPDPSQAGRSDGESCDDDSGSGSSSIGSGSSSIGSGSSSIGSGSSSSDDPDKYSTGSSKSSGSGDDYEDCAQSVVASVVDLTAQNDKRRMKQCKDEARSKRSRKSSS